MATITARVQLRGAESFDGHGHKFKRNQVKVLSNPADIRYFQMQPAFKVTILGKAAPAKPTTSAPPAPAGAAGEGGQGDDAPEGEDGGSEAETGEGDSEDGEPSGPLPWKPGMRKAELLAAAESRGIAVTEDDNKATIVQMLREHDEDQAG